jgi:hypothetical protein
MSMKRYIRLLPLLFCLPLLFPCGGEGGESTPASTDTFVMTARITAIGDKIEVEVSKGPYGAEGIYWVNTGAETSYFDKNGAKIKRGDLTVGDAVEITYGGQVAMSLPPQIFASAIKKQ